MRQVQAIDNLVDELGLSKKRELFEFLVRSQSDIDGLRECIQHSNRKPILGLLEFRRKKILNDMMSIGEFKKRFNELPKEALESLFQQPVSLEETSEVKSSIHSGKTSLDGIYQSINIHPALSLRNALKIAA